MPVRGERDVFAARARESGVVLTEAEIDHLFVGYGLLQRLVADLDPAPQPGLDPAFIFVPPSMP